jgi:hypothetical protein
MVRKSLLYVMVAAAAKAEAAAFKAAVTAAAPVAATLPQRSLTSRR